MDLKIADLLLWIHFVPASHPLPYPHYLFFLLQQNVLDQGNHSNHEKQEGQEDSTQGQNRCEIHILLIFNVLSSLGQ